MLWNYYFNNFNNTIVDSDYVRKEFIKRLRSGDESLEDLSLNEFLVDESKLMESNLCFIDEYIGFESNINKDEKLYFSFDDFAVLTFTAIKEKYCEAIMDNCLHDTTLEEFMETEIELYPIENSEDIIDELIDEAKSKA